MLSLEVAQFSNKLALIRKVAKLVDVEKKRAFFQEVLSVCIFIILCTF